MPKLILNLKKGFIEKEKVSKISNFRKVKIIIDNKFIKYFETKNETIELGKGEYKIKIKSMFSMLRGSKKIKVEDEDIQLNISIRLKELIIAEVIALLNILFFKQNPIVVIFCILIIIYYMILGKTLKIEKV